MNKSKIDKMQYILIGILISALVLVLILGTIKTKSVKTSNTDQIEEKQDIQVKDSEDTNKESEKEVKEDPNTKKDEEKTVVTGTVSIDELNVRSAPSVNSSTIATIKKDGKVTALFKNKEWIKIQYNDITGYVHSDYLSLDGELQQES